MKNLLLSLLLLSTLSSFAEKKEKPRDAVKEGSITAITSMGYPKMISVNLEKERIRRGMLNGGLEYQVSRRISLGLQYCYNQSAMDMQPVKTYYQQSLQTIQWERSATWIHYLITFDVCWLNRGRVCLSSGIGYGMMYSKHYDHMIDSAGLDTRTFYRGKEPAARIRLVNAKVRIAKNFGAYAGIGMGNDGMIVAGAYYTFVRLKNLPTLVSED